jgi:hypothetical protein
MQGKRAVQGANGETQNLARIMSRSKPVIEGNTGIKFSEIVVMGMAIALVVFGVRAYLDHRHSASFALGEFMGAIKAGNVGNQYALIDEGDKKRYFPNQGAYEKNTLAHGYTERVETYSMGPEEKKPNSSTKVTIPITVSIRATAEGKQLYQIGQTQTYSDKIVMRKNSDGNWRVVYSESIDKSTQKLHLQDATPSPTSIF